MREQSRAWQSRAWQGMAGQIKPYSGGTKQSSAKQSRPKIFAPLSPLSTSLLSLSLSLSLSLALISLSTSLLAKTFDRRKRGQALSPLFGSRAKYRAE
jgi:hypothetical protein